MLVDLITHSAALSALKKTIGSYAKIQDSTWTKLQKHYRCKTIAAK